MGHNDKHTMVGRATHQSYGNLITIVNTQILSEKTASSVRRSSILVNTLERRRLRYDTNGSHCAKGRYDREYSKVHIWHRVSKSITSSFEHSEKDEALAWDIAFQSMRANHMWPFTACMSVILLVSSGVRRERRSARACASIEAGRDKRFWMMAM